jgi:hypothetical protein
MDLPFDEDCFQDLLFLTANHLQVRWQLTRVSGSGWICLCGQARACGLALASGLISNRRRYEKEHEKKERV